MRFRRETAFRRAIRQGRQVTPRRLAAAKRRLEREVDAMPLFADEVRASQPTPAQRIARMDADATKFFQAMRDHAARNWRRGRCALQQLPPQQRQAIIANWNASPLPATATYFVDYLRTKHQLEIPET